jgi:competence protein ComEC
MRPVRVTRTRTHRKPPRPAPLLLPTVCFLTGIWLADHIASLSPLALLAALILPPTAITLLLTLPKHLLTPTSRCLLIATCALPIGFLRHHATLDKPPHHITHAATHEPVTTRLVGQIISPPVERPATRHNPFLPFEPPPQTHFILDAHTLLTTKPPSTITGHIRVTIKATQLNLLLGQTLELTGRLARPRPPRNPGEPDWARWAYRQGIDANLSVPAAEHIRAHPTPPGPLARLTRTLRAQARGLLFEPDAHADPAGELLDVMVLGQRRAAGRTLNDAFRRAGAMHYLAVSGFHVGVLAFATWWISRRLVPHSRTVAAVTTLLATLLYALVAEPNAPILRAATVVIFATLAVLTRRPVCLVNTLALAAATITTLNPHELFRPGFQFSFVQTLALVIIIPRLHHHLFAPHPDHPPPGEARTLFQLLRHKAARWLIILAAVCTTAWLTAIPLGLLHFSQFTPWGWLSSLLLAPAIILIIFLSFAAILLNLPLQALNLSLSPLLQHATNTLLASVQFLAQAPGALIESPPPPAWLVAATYATALLLMIWPSPTPNPGLALRRPIIPLRILIKITTSAFILLSWLAWLILPPAPSDATISIHVLDVGDGNTILLNTPNHHAFVCDVGTTANHDTGLTAHRTLQHLRARRLDAVIISHANFDHYSGLPTLLEKSPPQHWYTSEYFIPRGSTASPVSQLLKSLPATTPPHTTLHAGQQLTLDNATLEVLWPPPNLDTRWKPNDRSLVMRITAANRSILLTGDIEAPALQALLDLERSGRITLNADILVAPHHGAVIPRLTADFLAAVSPSLIIASTHKPRPQLATLAEQTLGPVNLLTTRTCGAVAAAIHPSGRITHHTPFAPRPAPSTSSFTNRPDSDFMRMSATVHP